MPTCIREQVFAALKTRLEAASYPGLAVERDRREAVTPAEMPRVVMFDETRTEVVEETDELKVYRVYALVEGYVTGASRAAVASALNALAGSLQAALDADKTLGGVALGAFEATHERLNDETEGHRPIGVLNMAVGVRFQTSRASPFA